MAPGGPGKEIFLGEDLGKSREYSESTAQKIDQEVEAILKKAYERAGEVLSSRRQAMDELAESLMQNDEVSGETVYAIVKGKKE